MKILQINNILYSFGGTEKYLFELSRLLENYGHTVAYFSMATPHNIHTKWDKYFVSNISLDTTSLKSSLKLWGRMTFSLEAKLKISKLIDDFKPDIVHIHNIYKYISPSILPEIKKRGIPIVQTIHDYHQLAPNRNLFHDGKICEITKPDKYYKALFHKCVKGSYSATFANIITLYIHRIFGLYNNNVDYFIAPSLFVKNKLVEYGFDSKKVVHLPNFIDIRDYSPFKKRKKTDKYVLYFGRLSIEKGLLFLLEVAKKLPSIEFKLVGEGPQETILKRYTRINSLSNVKFLDYHIGEKLRQIILNSYFVILPSLWYENLPISILESFAYFRSVIGSNIGGIPETIKPYKTGLLFNPDYIKDCIQKINYLWNHPKRVIEMGIRARYLVENTYDYKKHYFELLKIYKLAIKQSNPHLPL